MSVISTSSPAICWPALDDLEFGGGLYLVDVVGRSAGDADDLGLGGLGAGMKDDRSGVANNGFTETQHLAAVLEDDGGGRPFERGGRKATPIVGDEEPAVAAALDHFLRGADGERVECRSPIASRRANRIFRGNPQPTWNA